VSLVATRLIIIYLNVRVLASENQQNVLMVGL